MIDLKLPALGADMDEGKLLEWRVHPGDAVHKGDVLAVVDTTKAALDVESWHDGTVWELLLEPGQTVPVGTLMARLLEPEESGPTAAHAVAPAPPPPRVTSSTAGAPSTAGAGSAPVAPSSPGTPSAPLSAGPQAGRRHVSPAARRRASELGVVVDSLTGSGPHGAVTLADVERAAAAPAVPLKPAMQAAAAAPAGPATPIVPAVAGRDRSSEIRRTIASVMARSKREIPHYYLGEDIPLAAAMTWLRQANANRPITERILVAALYIRAVARAARQHPTLNGYFRDGEFRPSAVVNLGIAISLRGGGLLAPAISHAEDKTVAEVMRALTDLVARTRAGSLRREEVADPTLTLTNLGDQSVKSVLPVIYAPQVAIVGFGAVSDRPWVVEGQVQVRPVVTATLAADHRVSDGHAGARFLATIAAELQKPESL